VLTEGQLLLCDLWAQALPLLEPFVQQLVVQSLSLDRSQGGPGLLSDRPAGLEGDCSVPPLSLPIKARLLSILPLSCLSEGHHEYLCAKVLRLAVQELEQWVGSSCRASSSRAQLVDAIAGLLQHIGLVKDSADILRCCQLVGLLFDAQNQRLLGSCPGLLRSVLHFAGSLDLVRCYTAQRTLRLLSSLEHLIVAQPWARPLIAQFLGNTSHNPLRFSDPTLQEEIFRKLCKLFHAVLSVKGQPELWCQFAAGLSMFHTFSSLNVVYEERFEELIPRIAYDDVIGYISGLDNPNPNSPQQEWELLVREQQGARAVHDPKKRASTTEFDQVRNVRLKNASSVLRDVCASIRTLKQFFGSVGCSATTCCEQFFEADRLWEELRHDVKKVCT